MSCWKLWFYPRPTISPCCWGDEEAESLESSCCCGLHTWTLRFRQKYCGTSITDNNDVELGNNPTRREEQNRRGSPVENHTPSRVGSQLQDNPSAREEQSRRESPPVENRAPSRTESQLKRTVSVKNQRITYPEAVKYEDPRRAPTPPDGHRRSLIGASAQAAQDSPATTTTNNAQHGGDDDMAISSIAEESEDHASVSTNWQRDTLGGREDMLNKLRRRDVPVGVARAPSRGRQAEALTAGERASLPSRRSSHSRAQSVPQLPTINFGGRRSRMEGEEVIEE